MKKLFPLIVSFFFGATAMYIATVWASKPCDCSAAQGQTEAQILNYLDEQKAAWNGVGDYSPTAVIDQAAHGIAEGDYREW